MPPSLRITTLCENTVSYPGHGLLGEHGLSMLVEVGDKRLLFDTGGGYTALNNALVLGIDFNDLDAVILSHGHHDHTGGIKVVLENRTSHRPLQLYAHPDALKKKYRLQEGREPRSNGIPWTPQELEDMGAKLSLQKRPVTLGERIILTGEIPRLVDLEKPADIPPTRMIKTDRGLIPDMLYDDQALAVETARGIVAILGCAHAGLINTLNYISELTGKRCLHALVGGTHLVTATDERLKQTIEALNDLPLEVIAPCHCTGARASSFLFYAFKDRFLFHHVGSVFEFE